MASNSILGLLFEISADPSKAQSAIAQFESAAGKSFERAKGGPKLLNDVLGETDKNLLSNRESMRLLGEDFGFRLPRSVSGAVAEIIPAIGSIGPVLLGVFAIEEIPKIAAGIKNLVNSWEGFGKAEQAAMAKAIKDTDVLYGKVKNVEQELDLFGKSQAEQAALHAKWAAEDSDRALQDLLRAEKKVTDLNDKVKEAKTGADAFAAGAGSAYAKQIEVATAEVNRAREAWKLADEKALLEQKRAREAMVKEGKKAAKAAEKLEKEWEKGTAFVRYGPTLEQLGIRVAHSVDGMTKSVDMDVKSLNLWIEDMQRVVPLLPILDRGVQGLTTNFVSANYVLHEGVGSARALAGAFSDLSDAELSHANTAKLVASIIESSTVQSLQASLAGIIGMIAGKKLEAEFNALYYGAEGAVHVAESIWPFNPALLARGLGEIEAAMQYAQLAGTSGRASRSGGGGGGGSSYSQGDVSRYRSDGGGDRGGGPPPATLAAGAGGRLSGTARVVVFGTDHELQNWVARAVNGAVERGVTVTATSSQRGSPIGH